MEQPSLMLASLEDLLVREFRLCQSLHALTLDERAALSKNDVPALSRLVEDKEVMLDELGQLEDERRCTAQECGALLGLSSASPSIAELSSVWQGEESGRLRRLREGIVTLTSNIRDLTSGNRALAFSALEQADAAQAFLLALYRPTLTYQPNGAANPDPIALTLDVDRVM